jgi:hypothetical protein
MISRSTSLAKLTVILLACVCLSGCGSSPNDTADRFMSLLVSGKHVAVQEMLAKDMRSMAGFLGGVSNQSLNPYYRFGSFKSYKLTELERAENSIRYKVIATTADGITHQDFMDLVREDGKWKIARF